MNNRDIFENFKSNNCELLEEYKNSYTPMKYQCSCGNISKIRYYDFKKGVRCAKCKSNKQKKLFSHSQEEINVIFNENGFNVIGIYINNRTPLECICSKGHFIKITLNSINNNQGCIKCKNDRQSVNQTGELNHRWIRDRTKVRDIQRLQDLSTTYTQKFRKNKNIIDINLHVDHIFPIKAFVEHGIYDLDIINCEDNLQILSKEENLKKCAKYDETIFLNWIKDKLDVITIS